MKQKKFYKVGVAVALVLAVGATLWFVSPVWALEVDISTPSPTTLGRDISFDVEISVEDSELLPIQSVDLYISKDSYQVTCEGLPLSTGSKNYTSSETGGGDVDVDATATWSYGYGYGYAVWNSTAYRFGYGYGYGGGAKSIKYAVTWSSPRNWPSGTYTIEVKITANGETFTKTKSVALRRPVVAGGGIAPTPDIEANLFGTEGEFSIDDEGKIQATIEATSTTGDFTITIEEGTIALDEDGDPLSSLTVEVDLTPPDPPADAYIIGLPYNLGPSGATFDPPTTVKFIVDPATLPPGVAVEDLVLAYYNEEAEEWVELPTTFDPATNAFTADASHFTTFTILAYTHPAAFVASALTVSPAEVDIGESVTIGVLVINTGDLEGTYEVTLKIDNIVEATKDVTLAGGASQTVTFTTAKDVAGSYAVTVDGLTRSFVVKAAPVPPVPPAPPVPPVVPPAKINWWLIGGIIAGVIAAIAVPLTIRRRRRA